jgi:cAMP phosphodiesterase
MSLKSLALYLPEVYKLEVRILGAHSSEAKGMRMSAILIDGVLALDAGGLTSSLSLAEQQRIKAILLTHHHFDHSRDLVMLAANGAYFPAPVEIYALNQTLEVINYCLLDGKIYADFSKWPSKDNPYLHQKMVEPLKPQNIHGYEVLPVPVRHAVSAIGFQVTSRDGASLFYTGDTGPGLNECWSHISPKLLIIEVSGPDKSKDFLESVGHLSPQLLKKELRQFRKTKGYLPRIVVSHIPPTFEEEVEREIRKMARELGTRVDMGYEGMKIRL